MKPTGRLNEAYPIAERPCCLKCRRVMRSRAGKLKDPIWYCPVCVISCRMRQTGTPGSSEYPLADRPHCIKCRVVMFIHRPSHRWVCKTCRASCAISVTKKHKPAKQAKPKTVKVKAPRVARAKRARQVKQDIPNPHCVIHRRPMYRAVAEWRCLLCERAAERERRRATRVDKPKKVKPAKLTHLGAEFPHAERAWCLECRVVMSVGGVPGHRRWKCGKCDISILQRGKGYGHGPRKRVAEIPIANKDYLKELRKLGGALKRIAGKFKGQEFNGNLASLRRAIAFYATPNPARDRRAVQIQIDEQCATPEEIAEAVPLPLTHIEAICEQLVRQDNSRYEWRPIGYDARHGTRQYGIFRKDAATVIHGVTERDDPLKYSARTHSDHLAAVADLEKSIKRLERRANRDGTALPWESKAETQQRLAGARRFS